MSLLPALNAFSVFLAIAAVGFLFLLVSLVFGEIFDHFDAGIDHDLGHGGPGFFSSRVLSVFITAFGCVGAIATQYGFGPVPSSAFGLISGLVFGGGVYAFARFLYQQQASSDVLSTDLVGHIGARRGHHPVRRGRPGPLPGRRGADRQGRARP